MEFLLGVITGLTSAILYGHYLNNQRKKEQERDRVKHMNDLKKIWTTLKITPEDMQFLNSSPPYPTEILKGLKSQLQDAIDREDFKEAARLRDLMNKK